MAHYIEWSTRIYQVYLKYAAPEDIHVYSIDEVFIDATSYLQTFRMTGRELARTIILDILKTTGITAAAGIGTESLSGQDRHGHRSQACPAQMNTGCGLPSWTR